MPRKLKVGDTFTLPGSSQPIEIIGFYDKPTFVVLGKEVLPRELSCEKTTWVLLRYQVKPTEPDQKVKWVRLECELKRFNLGTA